jgi:DNA processing protein
MSEVAAASAAPYKEYARWIALSEVRGLGGVAFKRLSAHFADPTDALTAPASELARVPGLGKEAIEGLLCVREWPQAEDRARRILASGVRILRFVDSEYPSRLRAIADPPALLYVKGTLTAADEMAVAVVGSRSASEYGRRVARSICRGLASSSVTIVSGMARGIDGAAHEAALDSGGRTIAVLGCGVDRVYPPEHEALYARICGQGAVISELPVGTRPAAFHFPARNRLISGLSLGVVVVEATERSGSLITAGLALEQNREVFAVPGEVGSSRSRGAHRLIRQGAKLVESASDIIEEIAPQLDRPKGAVPSRLLLPQHWGEDAQRIFNLLQERTLHIDELIELSRVNSARVSQILLELELQGFLRQLPGKRYALQE